MQTSDDDKPLPNHLKVTAYNKLRIPERLKKNLIGIILEPHTMIVIGEKAIELSNNTCDRTHTYTVHNTGDSNEYVLTGDIPYQL